MQVVPVAAFLLVVAAFAVDAFTPQTLMIALLYGVPIALAALTPSRRLTRWLLGVALGLNVVAALVNAAHDAFRWDLIALEDRALVSLSIILVGLLTFAVQVRAENLRLAHAVHRHNEALNDRQALIQELVDAVAHDVRTPLAALSVTLSQAAEGAFGPLPTEYASVLRDSRVSIDDLQRLAETLLLVARYDSAQPPERLERIAIVNVVRGLMSEFAAMAQARGLILKAHVDEPAPKTLGSSGDLRRALANLIANAITHTPRGGTIDVCVRATAEFVEIAVLDDGYGIEPRLRCRLFERNLGASGGGSITGLGLYIVRRIAQEAGGDVSYRPRLPKGSAFTLSIPRIA